MHTYIYLYIASFDYVHLSLVLMCVCVRLSVGCRERGRESKREIERVWPRERGVYIYVDVCKHKYISLNIHM